MNENQEFEPEDDETYDEICDTCGDLFTAYFDDMFSECPGCRGDEQ